MKHYQAASLARGRWLLYLLICCVGLTGCVVSRNPVSGNKRAYGYTWEQEVQLGREADQQIIQQFGIYSDQDLQNYVEQVGERVLNESHLRRPDTPAEFRNTPFTFRVLDNEVVNAFALPGGFVYLTRGLLTHLNNEAQLAVVLGHEIGHVAARHSSAQAAKAQLGQIGLLGGAILGQTVLGGGAAENILNLGGQGLQLLFLSYSRENERESDKLGVEYAALSRYQAAEGAEFFRSLERLSQDQGGSIPSWASTHPEPEEREKSIPRLAAQYENRVNMTIVEREQYLQRLEGTVLGKNPRAGYTQDNVFYHPELRFQFPVPRNFRVDNQAAQVVMVDPNGQAVLQFTIANESSAEEAARALAGQQGIQVVESGRSSSGNLPAYIVIADAAVQGGQTIRLLAYYVEYAGKVYVFYGYAASPNLFSQYQDEFLRSMRGFAALTDSRYLNVQPTRVNLVKASRSAPFRTFIPANLPADLTAEDLAILNQVELDDVIQAGTLLKMPR